LGSGTTSVVSRKLGRRYIGIEAEEEYCLLAEKRIAVATEDSTIQGLQDGVFWERNTLALQLGQIKADKSLARRRKTTTNGTDQISLLD
ncbi:MAG: DNA methyltransferase, partial [Pseudomonadota bacterium]